MGDERTADVRSGPGALLVEHVGEVHACTLRGEQVRYIFAGRIANWNQVGGADGAINLYIRDEASGTREVVLRLTSNSDLLPGASVTRPLSRTMSGVIRNATMCESCPVRLM